MTSVSVELDDHVRKQIVVMCLTEFYRSHDPRQLPMVEATFFENSKDVSGLFERILKRYPRAPRDYFEETLLTLRGLDSSQQQQQANKAANSTVRSKHAQVQELLREGAALLAEPSPTAFFVPDDHQDLEKTMSDRDDDVLSRMSGYTLGPSEFTHAFDDSASVDNLQSSPGHRDDLLVLRQLIDDNRKLADEVAVAEQQVLQKRFEVTYLKVVSSSSKSETANTPPSSNRVTITDDVPSFLMVITDRERQFEIPCSAAEVSYIQQGPLHAPWSLDESEHCLVHFISYSDGLDKKRNLTGVAGAAARDDERLGVDGEIAPQKVMRTVLAMAMRVWSRRRPHAVSERLPEQGEFIHHTSSILWWQWPSACEGQRGVAPESLITAALPVDGVDRALRRLDMELDAPSAVARQLTPLHDEVCHLLSATPSRASLGTAAATESSPNRDESFWKYFVQQYGALSRSAPIGAAQ